MTGFEGTLAERMALVDVVDHLLNRGVVLSGGATLSLAGVDLVYLGLNVLLSSVETLQGGSDSPPWPVPQGPGRLPPPVTAPLQPMPVGAGPLAPSSIARTGRPAGALPSPQSEWYPDPPSSTSALLSPDDPAQAGRPERDLVRLVLTLVELLRQLLERQAVRRMEGGGLSAEEVERMGLALSELEARMAELRLVFGLEEGDLNLDLGPLGQLL